ncbi:MAG: hypothetical protein LBK60_00525 [Verrucomicrobiales bacterium]|nr:hypothetical protein [Verrucomicrobiales bacterium]
MDQPLTAVRDYAQIIQATIDGKKPLVVGGHPSSREELAFATTLNFPQNTKIYI